MCGIAGFVSAHGAEAPDPRGLHDAVAALAHRGPDQSGTYEAEGVGLGFTRLSIIDLPGGGQPMKNEDGSVVAVYNGEIWNHGALREDLIRLGHRFASRSDTEVIVHGYEEWGADVTQHLDGMFAFAIWDVRRAQLLLARDRFGKKPLYVQRTESGVAFGSDARSIFLVTGTQPRINEPRIAEYLFQRYVVSPHTLFAGVDRLAPAHRAVYDRSDLRISRFWQIDATEETRELKSGELCDLLRAATARRLMSDVGIGILLSGGVDSTAVLALAREAGEHALATFTVGFDDPLYDERDRARLAARHFSTDHHELVVGAGDFREAWPRLSWYRDEPIAEASEIPLLLLAEFAGRHVRVALSGDGGDEVFGGYPKYRVDALLRSGGWAAALAVRSALRLMKTRRTHRQLDRAAETLSLRDPLVRWVSWFRTTSPAVIDELLEPALAVDALPERLAARLSTMLAPFDEVDAGRRMLLGDLFTYLPDNMLLRSDKVLMAGSLEGRMPLLDVALVRRASSAPSRSRASVLRSKRILREATATMVPSTLRGGPKRGFPVPVERFLVGQEGDLVRRLLLSDRTLSRGLFRPDSLRKAVLGSPQERLGSNVLFVLASLELWARANVDHVTTSPPEAHELLDGDAPARPAG